MRQLLPLAVGARMFNDTGIQIFGPYLAAISAGLGISIISLGLLNSLRSMMGLAAPVVGSIADNVGYRPTLRALLLLSSAGSLVFALSPNLPVAVIGIILMGLGVFSFAPVLQAYMSAQIPYRRRSRGLGILEYGWALAGIVGLSVSGLLIDRFGWRAPFIVLSFGLFIAFFVFGAFPETARFRQQLVFGDGAFPETRGDRRRLQGDRALLPSQRHQSPSSLRTPLPRRIVTLIQLESNVRSAWAAIVVNALNVFAASTITIVYGVWLGREYRLTTTQLGLVALALGLSELTGSVLVSLIGDRFGKHRSVLASSVCAAGAYLLLPVLDAGLFGTINLKFEILDFVFIVIAGLLIARFLFEVSIVSSISLLSEQVPNERGKVLALASAMVTSGVAAASVVGPLAYTAWGIAGPAFIAAVCSFLASLLAIRWVTER